MKTVVGRWSLVVGKIRRRPSVVGRQLSFCRPRPSFLPSSVIPTGVRPPEGWSNGVEEPAVRWHYRASRIPLNFVATLGPLLLCISCPASAQGQSRDTAQRQLNEITSALMNGSVASIDILHIPDGVETRASVTPANLEKWFDFKITINKVREWSSRDDLVKVLRAIRLAPASRMVDMRSAIVFNGSDGNRLGTLYVGRFFGRYIDQFGGTDGAIGNMPVSFKRDLASWLKDMIPSSLR